MNTPFAKYLSFSLYGDKEMYCQGAIRNAQMAPQFYPGWKVVVYYDKTVPKKYIRELEDLNTELIDMTGSPITNKMLWRFLAYDFPDCGVFLSRDADSRLSERESGAVAIWLQTEKAVHVIRDHPNHGKYCPIGGGMWGMKRKYLEKMEPLVRGWKGGDQYGSDQDFLKYSLLPKIKRENAWMQHDSETASMFPGSFPLPPRKSWRFVGERYNADDTPATDEWKMITGYSE